MNAESKALLKQRLFTKLQNDLDRNSARFHQEFNRWARRGEVLTKRWLELNRKYGQYQLEREW
jgi:uracil DNA glycosylase